MQISRFPEGLQSSGETIDVLLVDKCRKGFVSRDMWREITRIHVLIVLVFVLELDVLAIFGDDTGRSDKDIVVDLSLAELNVLAPWADNTGRSDDSPESGVWKGCG